MSTAAERKANVAERQEAPAVGMEVLVNGEWVALSETEFSAETADKIFPITNAGGTDG